MGKQSARLYYQGKDHKDIFFHEKYHGKMFKNGQILWEKLFPDEYFVMKNNNASTNQGVGILNKDFYDMLPSAHNICVCGNVGKTLIGYCIKDKEDKSLIYSVDFGKSWTKFNIASLSAPNAIAQRFNYSASSRSFAYIDSSYKWSIARFGDDGYIDSVQTNINFAEGYGIVWGYSENYAFYKIEGTGLNREVHIRNVDQDGNTIGERIYVLDDDYPQLRSYAIRYLWHGGGTIYGQMGGDSAAYSYTYIISFNNLNGTYTKLTNYSERSEPVSIIYSDSRKTVAVINFRNPNGQYSIARIFAFADIYQTIKELDNGLIPVRSKDGSGYIDVGITTSVPIDTAIISVYDGSCLYVNNDNIDYDDSNGICFYGNIIHKSGIAAEKCAIYFDNIYLNQSSGNYYELI